MNLKASVVLPVLLFLFCVFSSIVIYRASDFAQDKHFSLLAESFTHGDLFLSPFNLPSGDYVDYRGKQYLYFGPMPSIILMPFVFAAGKNFPQMALSVVALILSFVGAFLLGKRFKLGDTNSLWLAIFFTFGTVLAFVSLVDISAYVAQATAMPFILFSLVEYFGKRRWLLIGTLVAAAGATRVTLFGISVFFLLEIWRQKKEIDLPLNITLFLIPVFVSVSVLGFYNFRRFGSFFDTGYTKNITIANKSGDNHVLGYFSPVHIPANIYSLFFMGPEPVRRDYFKVGSNVLLDFVLKFPYLKVNGYGLAIWYTSPLFAYLLFLKRKSFTINALIASFILLMPSLVYFGIGASQYGYRYSLDFIPLLFLVLLPTFEENLPNLAKGLIAYGAIFNCIYMLSIWNSYPIFAFWKYF